MVYRDGPTTWRVEVTAGNEAVCRFIVAHELAHLLLEKMSFQSHVGIDQNNGRDSLEELICDYAARLLLIPEELFVEQGRHSSNPATLITRIVPQTFGVTRRVSAARWLDLAAASGGSGRRAVIAWEQYDPFDPAFVRSCVRSHRRLCDTLSSVAADLRHLSLARNGARAAAIWAEATSPNSSSSFLVEPDLFRQTREGIANSCRALRPTGGSSQAGSEMDVLKDWKGPRAFRPEWFLANPSTTFIPVRRGGMRSGSMIANIASSRAGAIEDCREEDVSIGQLKGRFLVHGYADGDADQGKRIVVATFEECPAR
jgi:hypothetical protein